jgi:hypothetical protein
VAALAAGGKADRGQPDVGRPGEEEELIAMPRKESEFDLVRKLVMKLPHVEESTIHGAPSWKLSGKLLTCPAIHKSAEPNSLLVKIAPSDRAQLLSTEPGTYYVTDHYPSDSVVLVRLSQIDRKSLQALLKRAWLFLSDSGK